MSTTWKISTKDYSDTIDTRQVKSSEEVFLTTIDKQIGLVLDPDEEDRFEVIAGYSHYDVQVVLCASSDQESIISDIVTKTVFTGINKENLGILAGMEDVTNRHDFFRDLVEREVNNAKDLFVTHKTATSDRPDETEDLEAFEFIVVISDHEDYVHWASQGSIQLFGINSENSINLLETDLDKFTHRTKFGDMMTGYEKEGHNYLLVSTRHILDEIPIDELADTINSKVHFDDKVKAPAKRMQDINLSASLNYGLISVL